MANISHALTNRLYFPSVKHDVVNSIINYDTYLGIGFSAITSIQYAIAGRTRNSHISWLACASMSFLEQMTSTDHQDRKLQAFSFILGVTTATITPTIIRLVHGRRFF